MKHSCILTLKKLKMERRPPKNRLHFTVKCPSVIFEVFNVGKWHSGHKLLSVHLSPVPLHCELCSLSKQAAGAITSSSCLEKFSFPDNFHAFGYFQTLHWGVGSRNSHPSSSPLNTNILYKIKTQCALVLLPPLLCWQSRSGLSEQILISEIYWMANPRHVCCVEVWQRASEAL